MEDNKLASENARLLGALRKIKEHNEEIKKILDEVSDLLVTNEQTESAPVTDEDVKQLLKQAGYKGARTVKSTHSFDLPEDPFELHPTCHHNDSKLMDLAQEFVSTKSSFKPSLFYVWGHAYEFDGDDNWERIEELVSGGKIIRPAYPSIMQKKELPESLD